MYSISQIYDICSEASSCQFAMVDMHMLLTCKNTDMNTDYCE